MAIENPHLRKGLREAGVGLRQVNFMPLAADNDWFKETTAFAAVANPTVAVTSFTKAYCPYMPTTVITVMTDDSGTSPTPWTAATVTIVGINQFGEEDTEVVAGVNSSGTWTATGVKAWAFLRSVSMTIAGTTTTSDAYIIGYAKTYGLGCRIAAAADVLVSEWNHAADAGTVSAVYHTYAVAGTTDGIKWLDLLVRAAPTNPRGQ